MAGLTATVDADRALVRLHLNWGDEPAVVAASIVRIVAGVETPVRLPGPLDANGQQLLSAGVLVVHDTEAPLDVPVRYEARSTYSTQTVRAITVANLIENSGFETDLAGWVPTGAGLARSQAWTKAGTWSMQVTPDGVTAIVFARTVNIAGVAPGSRYLAGAWVRLAQAWADVRIAVDWYDASGGFLSTTLTPVVSLQAGVPARLSGLLTTPAGAYQYALRIRLAGTPPAGVVALVDEVEMVPVGPTMVLSDAYTRTVVDGWGAPSFGPPYTLSGTAAAFDVNAGVATITPAAGVAYRATVAAPADVNVQATVSLNAVATGAPVHVDLLLRELNADNVYRPAAVFGTNGVVELRLELRRGLSTVVLSSVIGPGYGPGTVVNLRAQMVGEVLRFKVWTGGVQPDWQITVPNWQIRTAGAAGVRVRPDSGNTNAGLVVNFFGLTITDLGGALVTVPSSGAAWLKDPLRPGRDVRVELGKVSGVCATDQRVWFVGFDGETYASDSTAFEVLDAPRPDVVSALRKDAASSLLLATRTLADRDALLALLGSGTPLLFQAPAVYGSPDRYLAVGEVGVAPISSDHRKPWRRFTLPFAVVDAPVGPAEGVAGVRWEDLDAVYPTWATLEEANLTGVDVLSGRAV